MNLDFSTYRSEGFYDELIDARGVPRLFAKPLLEQLSRLDLSELNRRRAAMDAAIITMGITFTVYSDGSNIDRAWPLDIIPRILPKGEWRRIEAGLKQRLSALNLFIDDLYNAQSIIKDGMIDMTRFQPIARLGYNDYAVVRPDDVFTMKRPA